MTYDSYRIQLSRDLAFNCLPGTFDGCQLNGDGDLILCSYCASAVDAQMAAAVARGIIGCQTPPLGVKIESA